MYLFRIIAILSIVSGYYHSGLAQVVPDSANSVTQPRSAGVQEAFPVVQKDFKASRDSLTALRPDSIKPSDTLISKVKTHKAKKAVWLSAVLPGLGQAYNKKYWKIPIIYAGFGGLSYAVYYTATNFEQARAAYRAVLRGSTTASYQGYTSAEDIKYFRDQYKNYLNISALVMVVWYGLNLIDAAVDGHLYSYNMDDKLSLNFDPSFLIQDGPQPALACMGLSVTLIPLCGRHKKPHYL